jgi:transcriptional regulator with XRE-family HTH domain
MSMGHRIQQQRMKRKMTAYALAKESGVSQSIIHYLEHGTRESDHIAVGTAKRLASVLGVTLDYLCGMNDENK